MPRSPRRRIRLATVIGGFKMQRSPVGLVHLRRFSTSNGCQDHMVLPYAATSTNPRPAMCCRAHFGGGVEAPFVRTPFDRSRKTRPAKTSRVPDAAASTASRPASLTIRIRPSVGQDGNVLLVIWGRRQEKFLKIRTIPRMHHGLD